MKNHLMTAYDKSLLPSPVGFQRKLSTLCIGLDIAWFGGAKNDPCSRYDFLAAALLGPGLDVEKVECIRVELSDHDLDAEKTVKRLNNLINQCSVKGNRVVLAVDAPLEAVFRGLPVRMSIPKKGTVKRRACEAYLDSKRKSIDSASGGAKGWHPNIQPGAPLAPRVESLLSKLNHNFKVWTPENSEYEKLIIECFPAEAIWGAKQMDWFEDNITALQAKAYKKQKGKRLIFKDVRSYAETALLPFGEVCNGTQWKDQIVHGILEEIKSDNSWKIDDFYPGGKMLDDVVDSLICLATAISYTMGKAHVWQDLNHPKDGHIIGPGRMQEFHTEKTILK